MSYAGYQYLAWYHDDLHARIARRALPSGALGDCRVGLPTHCG